MVDKSNDIKIEILPDDYQHYDKLFKVIVIGNSGILLFIFIKGVGKSCLSFKASKNIFMNNYLATVGFEFFNFNAKIEDKIIKLHIWDTCGQENYRSLVTQFYRDTSLAIIVYAIDE